MPFAHLVRLAFLAPPRLACSTQFLSNNGNPAGSGKSGYLFTTGTGTVSAGLNVGYTALAVPITINQTGIRAFCAEEDAVVRVDPAGACSNTEAGILTFNPLNQ